MPEFTSRDLGGVNDVVELRLNGGRWLIAGSYDVRMSFFRRPSVFALPAPDGAARRSTSWTLSAGRQFRFRFIIAGAHAIHWADRRRYLETERRRYRITFHGRDDLALLRLPRERRSVLRRRGLTIS